MSALHRAWLTRTPIVIAADIRPLARHNCLCQGSGRPGRARRGAGRLPSYLTGHGMLNDHGRHRATLNNLGR
jgi:hypothetical protein